MHRLLAVGSLLPPDLPGFALQRAETLPDARQHLAASRVDAALLGPDFSHVQGITGLRRTFAGPLVCLTAQATPGLAVRLLDAGAHAVLETPADPLELGARLRALLRRHVARAAPLRVVQLTLDLERRAVHYGQAPLPFRPREFEVLACLAQHAGTVCSREFLTGVLWGTARAPGRTAVDLSLSGIRRHLRRVGAGDLLRTVRGQGWVLRGDG